MLKIVLSKCKVANILNGPEGVGSFSGHSLRNGEMILEMCFKIWVMIMMNISTEY
jgi:hypothetical protein